jgi:hypothetical protein
VKLQSASQTNLEGEEMAKAAFIKTTRDARAEWKKVLAEVGEERMLIPGAAGYWSVKDMIAHLSAWEQRPVAWLTAIGRGESPAPAPWPPDWGEEKTNAWIYEANKDRPLQEVIDESRRVHEQLLQELEKISDEELNDRGRFAWLDGNSLAEAIPGDASEHYQEHIRMVHEWLARETSQ